MPGLASYGQSGDYSQLFASLTQTYLNQEQQYAQEADNRRLDNAAAKDAETFDLYQAGKLPGGDAAILAYIAKRKRDTAYDPKQQEQWVKAELDYTKSINDGKAEAAYAAGGSIWNLIAYYQGQMASMGKNNPAYRDLATKVRQLTDQGVSQDVQRGAERISSQISQGKATLSDLLTFYQQHLRSSRPGSDIRNQITQAIADTQTKLTQQGFETNLSRIQADLSDNKITAQQAGQKMTDLVQSSTLLTSDPARYYSIMGDATKLTNTIDDSAQLAAIDYKLASGEITPSVAQQMYYAEADRFKTIDPTTYHNLRMKGLNAAGTALTNPDALGSGFTPPGVPGFTPPSSGGGSLPSGGSWQPTFGPSSAAGSPNRNSSEAFRWVSQMDGTEFASINCSMASAAMLAYVMGVSGLSGGDLRYLSGDTSGGLDLSQVQQVLKKVGVKGLDNTLNSPIDFAAFKARMLQGSPAIVSGIYGNVPSNLRVSPKLWGTHQMMVAQYDAKKDAFLVYDPAVSKNQHPNYNGEWWPASAIKNFGWGPSLNGYTKFGQVLFTPAGTVKPGQTQQSHPARFVSVDDPPQRPNTPKSYVGLNNPGPSGQAPGVHPTITTGGNPKTNPLAPTPAGQQTRPQTTAEAQALLQQNQSRIDTITAMTDAFARGDTNITIGGQNIALDAATVTSLNQEVLWRTDHDIALNEAMGDMSSAAALRDKRAAFVTAIKVANTIPVARLWGTLVRDVKSDLNLADLENDPARAYQAVLAAQKKLTAFQQVQVNASTNDELSGIPATDVPGTSADQIDQQKIDVAIKMLQIAADKDIPGLDKGTQIADLANAAGLDGSDPAVNLIAHIAGATTDMASVENGTGVQVLINGVVRVAPVRQQGTFDANGQPTTVNIPDIGAVLDDNGKPLVPNASAATLVTVPIDGPTGPTTLLALPDDVPIGNLLFYKGASTKNDATSWVAGQYLTSADLSDPKRIADLKAQGRIGEKPYTVPSIQMPPTLRTRRGTSVIVPGQTWAQDPGTMEWSTYTPGQLPAFVAHRGGSYANDPTVLGWNMTTQLPDIGFQKPDNAVPAPYDGKNNVAVQKAIDSGQLPIAPTWTRDPNGELAANAPVSPYDPPPPPISDTPSETNYGARFAADHNYSTSQTPPAGQPDPQTGYQPPTGPDWTGGQAPGKGVESLGYTPPNPTSFDSAVDGVTSMAKALGITLPSFKPPAPPPAPAAVIPPPPTASHTYNAKTAALPKITIAQTSTHQPTYGPSSAGGPRTRVVTPPPFVPPPPTDTTQSASRHGVVPL